MEPVLRVMMETPEPIIYDVPGHDQCHYEPRIGGWDCGIEVMVPELPADEFKQNMEWKNEDHDHGRGWICRERTYP